MSRVKIEEKGDVFMVVVDGFHVVDTFHSLEDAEFCKLMVEDDIAMNEGEYHPL